MSEFVYPADCFFEKNMLFYKRKEEVVIPMTQVLAPLYINREKSPGTERRHNA